MCNYIHQTQLQISAKRRGHSNPITTMTNQQSPWKHRFYAVVSCKECETQKLTQILHPRNWECEQEKKGWWLISKDEEEWRYHHMVDNLGPNKGVLKLDLRLWFPGMLFPSKSQELAIDYFDWNLHSWQFDEIWEWMDHALVSSTRQWLCPPTLCWLCPSG